MSRAPVRIGNASGFYGDRLSAMREMLEGGQLDYLTGDYLAELTMLILGRDRMKDPSLGYAKTFLRQMEDCFAIALEKKVKIVVNAGGLNPVGLATALRALAEKLKLTAKIAHVEGDDLIARSSELGFGSALTANAYLGGWGIVECLKSGADVVVTGRVTDASVIVGSAAAHFDWKRDDWDRLAAATVAGHVIECGTQATGGNYAFFTEIDVRKPGFPLAEIHDDGTIVITKHPGTGGAVTTETVTAQLLYEVGGARYAGPDVTTRLDTLSLAQDGADRVKITGVIGEPPPKTVKVCLNHLGGFRNQVEFVLTGLNIAEKAALIRGQVEAGLKKKPSEIVWALRRSASIDADTEEDASTIYRVTVKDQDNKVVGRAFSAVAVEVGLGTYPGFTITAPPADSEPYGVYTPAYVDAKLVPHVAVLADGTRVDIAPTTETRDLAEVDAPTFTAYTGASTPTKRVPLGTIMGARSGDKGGVANIGVWARNDESFAWLADFLTIDRLKELLPEAGKYPVTRHVLPKIRGLNFLVDGMLGQGVSSSTRFDPQGKGLGEWLRARSVEIPEKLLA